MKKVYVMLLIMVTAYFSLKESPKQEEEKIPTIWEEINYLSKVDTLETKSKEYYRITSKHYEVEIFPDSTAHWKHVPYSSHSSSQMTKEDGGKILFLINPIKSVERVRKFKDGIMFNIEFKDSSSHMVIVQGEKSHPWSKHKGDWVNWSRYPGHNSMNSVAPGHATTQEKVIGTKVILQFIQKFPDSAGTKQENKRVVRALNEKLKKLNQSL